jgi:hypothetical protein
MVANKVNNRKAVDFIQQYETPKTSIKVDYMLESIQVLMN